MTNQVINVGVVPNDGTGDSIRDAFIKVNQNFSDVYSTFNTIDGQIDAIHLSNNVLNSRIDSVLLDVKKLENRIFTLEEQIQFTPTIISSFYIEKNGILYTEYTAEIGSSIDALTFVWTLTGDEATPYNPPFSQEIVDQAVLFPDQRQYNLTGVIFSTDKEFRLLVTDNHISNRFMSSEAVTKLTFQHRVYWGVANSPLISGEDALLVNNLQTGLSSSIGKFVTYSAPTGGFLFIVYPATFERVESCILNSNVQMFDKVSDIISFNHTTEAGYSGVYHLAIINEELSGSDLRVTWSF